MSPDRTRDDRSGDLVTIVLVSVAVQFGLIVALLVLNRFDSAPRPTTLASEILVSEPATPRVVSPPSEPEPPPETDSTPPIPDISPQLPALEPSPASVLETSVTIPEARPPLPTTARSDRSPLAPSVPVTPLRADEVDTPPVFRASNQRGQYPLLARRRRWSGTVWVRVLVDTSGSVSRVAGVVRTEGKDAFRKAVLDVASSWRFDPARHRGRAVPVWVDQPIRFEIER